MSHKEKETLEPRFWSKIDFGDPDDCWLWTAARDGDGYGMIWDRDHHERSHRVMMILLHGPLGDADLVLHHCDNPRCVNPLHLYIGDHADNTRDRMVRSGWQPPDNTGSKNGQAKLTEDEVRQIKRRLATDGSQRSIAEDYGVDPSTISNINRCAYWTHVEVD